jgi:hypothetical protein
MGNPVYHPNPGKVKDTWMLAAKKRERIAGLTVLLREWEEREGDSRYIRSLKSRLLKTQKELEHMKV